MDKFSPGNKLILDIICNKCGGLCSLPQDKSDPGTDNYGLNNASFVAGYYSEKFMDLDKITFSICEECLFELFLTFKIPPEAQEIGACGEIRGKKRLLKLVGKRLL